MTTEGGHWQDHHQPTEQAMVKQVQERGEEEMLDHGQSYGVLQQSTAQSRWGWQLLGPSTAMNPRGGAAPAPQDLAEALERDALHRRRSSGRCSSASQEVPSGGRILPTSWFAEIRGTSPGEISAWSRHWGSAVVMGSCE